MSTHKLHDALTGHPPSPFQELLHSLSDLALADAFAEWHRDDLAFIAGPPQRWHVRRADGTFTRDDTLEVDWLVRNFLRRKADEVAEERDWRAPEDSRRLVLDAALRRLGSARLVRTLEWLARSDFAQSEPPEPPA